MRDSPSGISFGPFRLDRQGALLQRGHESLHLTPKAFALLQYLAERPGQLVAKRELLDALWPETFVAEAALTFQIRELRKVLGDDVRAPRYIATVSRRGYRFVAPVADAAGAPATAGRQPVALVGRDREWALLAEAYTRACAGERQIVLVGGEGGIGKTALVDAFTAALPGGGRARGQCLDAHGSGEAYLPLLEVLGELANGARGALLTELLRTHAPSWLPSLPWATSRRGAAPALSRQAMQRELTELLERFTAEDPLVVVLEDLHWSDASTVDLLARLAHRRGPCRLMVVGTYRPIELVVHGHPLRAVQQRLVEQRLCADLHLPYLTAPAVERYLGYRVDGVPPPGLAEAIAERTGGNALFMVNLIDDLLARGWLGTDGGTARLTVPLSHLQAAVPDGVRQMIEAQVERLPPADAERLEAASAVGQEFSSAAVAAALGEPFAEIERFCQAEGRHGRHLQASGAVAVADGRVCDRYQFSHALARDVFYQRLGAARRLQIHRRLGEWLDTQGASAAEIARHLLLAAESGCAAQAVQYARRAAESAEALFAFGEAAQHYDAALAVLPDDDWRLRAELLIALGWACQLTGNLARAATALLAAVDAARAAGAPALFARAVLTLGRGQHVVLEADPRLIALLEEALEGLGGDPSLRACVLARLDTALSPMPDTVARREALRAEALALAEQVDDPDTWLWVLLFIRWGATLRGGAAEIRRTAERATDLAGRAASVEQVMYFNLLRVSALLEVGEVGGGTAALDDLAGLAERSSLPWFRWSVVRFRTMLALQAGEFATAKQLADDAVQAAEGTEDANVWAAYRAQSVHRYVLQGRFDEVEPLLRAFVEANAAVLPPRVALADLYRQRGDLAAARRHFEILAAADFAGIPRDSFWLVSLAQVVELCAALADAPRAAQLRRLLDGYTERIFGAASGVTAMGHGDRYLGLLAATLGEWDEAARRLDRALDIHARIAAGPWLAYTLVDRARTLMAQPLRGAARTAAHRRAAADLEQAAQLAERIGMQGLAAQIAGLVPGS